MVLEVLRKRRSIRAFRAAPLESEKVEALKEAVLRAPSSRARNPWEFVFVTDPALLEGISKAREHGTSFVRDAALAVVVAADPEKSDVWVEDCSIAAIILQLAAESLGLGSCWSQIRLRPHSGNETAEDYLKRLLSLPETFVVEAVVSIGYAAEQKPGHRKEELPYGKIHTNRFKAA